MRVIIRNTPDTFWSHAASILQTYLSRNVMTRTGVRNGVSVKVQDRYWYIYCTKTAYVIYLQDT